LGFLSVGSQAINPYNPPLISLSQSNPEKNA
jgi:hypothetical protein